MAVGGDAGPSKTFALRVGDVLRVGRDPASDFVLALGGVSTCHAELFLRSSATRGAKGVLSTVELYIRDTSKNGTGVQSVVPGKWQGLPRGGLTRLQNDWKLLLPLRGRPAEANELAHTLTVSVAALESTVPPGVAAIPVEGQVAPTGDSVKAKTPQRKGIPREKKARKEKAKDGTQKRKREAVEDGLSPLPAGLAAALDEVDRQTRADARREARQHSATGRLSQPVVDDGLQTQKGPNGEEEPRMRKHRRRRREGEKDDPERAAKREERRRRRGQEGGAGRMDPRLGAAYDPDAR